MKIIKTLSTDDLKIYNNSCSVLRFRELLELTTNVKTTTVVLDTDGADIDLFSLQDWMDKNRDLINELKRVVEDKNVTNSFRKETNEKQKI